MIREDFDDLGRALARRASRRGLLTGALPRVSRPAPARIDALSRALAVPMSRRRAVGVISGTLVAGALWRPRLAGAVGYDCSGDTPQKCATTGGAQVCVGNDWHCCSNQLCAGACRPWEKCSNAGTPASGCDDTPQLCIDARVATPGRTTFFYERRGMDLGICHGSRTLTYGWCCRPGDKKGATFGSCVCTGEDCGSLCCKEGTGCEHSFFYGSSCVKLCSDGRKPCGGACCSRAQHCATAVLGNDTCECPSGTVVCASGCCPERKQTETPSLTPEFIQNWLGTLGATSAAHGGAHSSAHVSSAHRAQASAGIDAALVALAAVNAQGGAALGAFIDGHKDTGFKRKVVAAKVSAPKLQAAAGLDAGSAAALNDLLSSHAHANALLAAAAAALGRSRGAAAKHDSRHARTQLLASARFTDQAVTVLKAVPGQRRRAAAALLAGKTLEVNVSVADLSALQATVRRSGVPAELRGPLAGLGVTAASMARVRAGMLQTRVAIESAAGPVLIAPLADDARTKGQQAMTSELARWAKKVRRHPIARGHL